VESISVDMFDWATGEPIKKENGRNEMHVRALPRAGDFVSFGRRAWRVEQMVFVDNGPIRCMCASVNDPKIAALSYR